ncbi:MAG: ATP-dependent DNA helicase [Planctomycetota bacterium]
MGSLRAEVEALLADDGPLARRLDGWEPRPQQEELALAIADAVGDGEALVAEAGTGVGKSFAYLVPAILWAAREGRRVVVSTRTKALQDQLDRKDLPFLQAVLGVEFTWALGVGRNNYLCLRRLGKARRDQGELFEELGDKEQLRAITAWAERGDHEGRSFDLSFVPDGRVWAEVQAEQGNCLNRDCPYFEPCYWQRGKRRMRTAQVLVVNHALYFADLALRLRGAAYLPEHELVVFDEAHHVEDIAGEALGLRLGPGQLEWQLGRLLSRSGAKGLVARHGLDPLRELVDRAREDGERQFRAVRERFQELAGDRDGGSTRLTTALPDELGPGLEALADALRDVTRDLPREAQLELVSRADRLEDLARAAGAFAAEPGSGEVRWLERERRQVVLRSAPVSVAGLLREGLFGRLPRAVLVSATLGPRADGFAWFRSRLGLEHARALELGSPFPYERNVELAVDDGLPDPVREPTAFADEASARAAELCLENGGRALVLCTSWRFLERCRAALEDRLAGSGITLLVQGTEPLPRLVDRKRAEPASVLLGTDSLWEGVDIPGDAVTLVVLTRFPFPVPSHPWSRRAWRRSSAAAGRASRSTRCPRPSSSSARASAGSSGPRPTGAAWSSSTPARGASATAGCSSTPCRRAGRPRSTTPSEAPGPRRRRSRPGPFTAADPGLGSPR